MFKKTPSFKHYAKRPVLLTALLLGLSLCAGVAQAQNWGDISPASQTMLRPLRGTWEQIPPLQRQQWLQHVPRLQNMNSSDRDNAQERMAEWASLSMRQRVQVEQRLKNEVNDNADTRNQSWTRYLKFR